MAKDDDPFKDFPTPFLPVDQLREFKRLRKKLAQRIIEKLGHEPKMNDHTCKVIEQVVLEFLEEEVPTS